MSLSGQELESRLTGLYQALGPAGSPVTFWIGAGGSLSSGGPHTTQVDDAVAHAVEGRRLPGEEVGHAFAQITPSERRRAVEDLFRGMSPHVGYLCLAAIARDRRVLILSLNWDRMVEDAAQLLSVGCRSFTSDSVPADVAAACEEPGEGIVIWHLHGDVDHEILHGRWPTMSFSDETTRTIASAFLCHSTIVVGSSINDLDVRRLMDRVPASDPSPPMFILVRGTLTPEDESDARALLQRRGSARNLIVSNHLDFDRVMVGVLAYDRASKIDLTRQPALGRLALTAWDSLVMPRSELLRSRVLRPVTVLVGEPRLGKTTVAWAPVNLRAHLFPGPVQVMRLEGPASSVRDVVASLPPRFRSAADDCIVVWIEDAFEAADVDEARALIDDIDGVVGAFGDRVAFVITNRRAGATAIERDLLQRDWVVSTSPRAWWGQAELLDTLAYFGGHGESRRTRQAIRRAIDAGQVVTPAAIRSRLKHLLPEVAGDEDEESILKETCSFLDTVRSDLPYLAAVRLSEITSGFVPRSAVDAVAPPPVSVAAQEMVHEFTADGVSCVALTHRIYRDAVDAALLPDSDIWVRFATLSRDHQWLARGMSRLEALRTVAADNLSALSSMDAAELARASADLLEVSRRTGLVGHLPLDLLDHWDLLPVVYELASGWDFYEHDPGARQFVLSDLLSDRQRMGVYCLAEALMYLSAAPPEALKAPLSAAVARMRDDPSSHRELALIIDALLVGLPEVQGLEAPDLLEDFLSRLTPADPALGALAFAWCYHPGGAADCDQVHHSPLELLSGGLTEAQAAEAAWMMQWHFAHQAQNRSLTSRHRRTDWHYMSAVGADKARLAEPLAERLRRLIRDMAEHESSAGWAFHLGLNAYHSLGPYDGFELPLLSILRRAMSPSVGILSALATYEVPDVLRAAARDYLAMENVQEGLLEVIAVGARLDEWNVSEPSFHFVRDLATIHDEVGLLPRLEKAGVDVSEPGELANSLRVLRDQVTGDSPAWAVDRLIEETANNDFRILEMAAGLRQASDSPPLLQVLEVAAFYRASQSDG